MPHRPPNPSPPDRLPRGQLKEPLRVGEEMWKRLDDHGLDIHLSVDGFVPHATTRVVRRADPRKAEDEGPPRMAFSVVRCLPPGNHYFFFAVPDKAAREAMIAARASEVRTVCACIACDKHVDGIAESAGLA